MSNIVAGCRLLTMPFDNNNGTENSNEQQQQDSNSSSPTTADPSEILRLLSESAMAGIQDDPSQGQLERIMPRASSFEEAPTISSSLAGFGLDAAALGQQALHIQPDFFTAGFSAMRNTSKTLKCPKCNWHYKYQETLEIHMKEKHAENEIKCVYCVENKAHPKLSRGESYSCGYKPYRCELCKYSTTTKGNLSIHMQSDKHLHAVQDLPNSIAAAASFTCPPAARSPIPEGDTTFFCLVCGAFAADDSKEMLEHAEKDRSRPAQGDVSMANGSFRCFLCPYSTGLKANFQLHMRTDKHIQKVQTVNHIREGTTGTSALFRLCNAKSPFQVYCRACQEVLTSGANLQEHCDSASHRTSLKQPLLLFVCRLCSHETTNKADCINHMTCHEPSTWPVNNNKSSKSDLNAMTMEEDAAYACASCGFTTKEVAVLEEHGKTHEEGDQCPLCSTRSTKITEHLIQEHKITEQATERLLTAQKAELTSASNGSSGGFSHRCSQCAMAFRSEAALQSHQIVHLFATTHKCSFCNKVSADADELKMHMEQEHAKEKSSRCELCSETFPAKNANVHFNSPNHLKRAKQQLMEKQGAVDLSSQALGNLKQLPSGIQSGEKTKLFRCNICNQQYGQGATFDIHLRSVAHQSRMAKMGELVATGEIDASKPIIEQPGGPRQSLIKDMIKKEDENSPATNVKNPMSILDLMNMLMQNPSVSGAGMPPMSFPLQAMTGSQSREETPLENAEEDAPSSGKMLCAQIYSFGTDRLISLCPELNGQLEKLTRLDESTVALIPRPSCSQCGEVCSSILALGRHSEEVHNQTVQDEDVRKFAHNILAVASNIEDTKPICDLLDNIQSSPQSSRTSRDNSEPPEKMPRVDAGDSSKNDFSQLAMFQMMSAAGFPFIPPGAVPSFGGQMPPGMADLFNPLLNPNLANSPQKRARTRITDDQLKVLRQYFDINNSPTEAQIKEMSIKSNLPEKVIKHWFRNTLFKERQRDKDSPYNFNIPPSMSIDLDTYEKTGEAKVVSLDADAEVKIKSEPSSSTSSLQSEKKPSGQSDTNTGGDRSSNNSRSSSQMAASSSAAPSISQSQQQQHSLPNLLSAPTSMANTPAAQLNFQAILSQMQQAAAAAASISPNPFQFMDPTALMTGGLPQLASSHASAASSQPGRRANRTRFTDFQLRTLQQFFEKQAYPKDDDLEMLSKKTGCSPRVVTVWFQNARQKARKIYENHPNHESNDRFVKTPGSNFQCKRCSLVFQRYYELIQHQQKKCYKDDGLAQANDNKMVEENLSADEKAQLAAQQATSTLAAAFTGMTGEGKPAADLLKLLGSPKSTTDALLKMCESAGGSASTSASTLPAALASLLPQGLLGGAGGVLPMALEKNENSSKSGFHKRCPFCGLLFKARQTMADHLQSKHATHVALTGFDVDNLPNADDPQLVFSPGFLLGDSEASKDLLGVLDLSSASANGDGRESLSMSPYPIASEGGDELSMAAESPDDLLFSFSSPTPGQMSAQLSKSPTSSKRYRTHLTPLQVHMMKCVFMDYKTPSMTECDLLGKEIGLHKRVVQVWFQNARAKERKVRMSNSEEEAMFRPQIIGTHCTFCAVDYGGRMSMQDHIFSKEHMKNVRAQLKTDANNTESLGLNENINKMPNNKVSALKSAMKSASIPNLPLGNGFPFSLVNGMMSPGMTNMPFLSDFSLIGTSVESLQIPDATKQQITDNIAAGLLNAIFTQDGETVEDLKESLNEADAADVTSSDKEVGWACTGCSYVFQEEAKAKEHQRVFGHQSSEVFVLIQTHYDCLACEGSFGMQKDYVEHLSSAGHLRAKLLAAAASVSGADLRLEEVEERENEIVKEAPANGQEENGNHKTTEGLNINIETKQELTETTVSE